MRAKTGAGALQAAIAGLGVLATLAAAQPAAARPPDVAARTPVASPGAASGSISTRRLESKLGGLMRGAGAGGGAWVYDVNSDRALFGFHANRRRVLASNTKLFTTAATLDRLGANRRLETSVWAGGRSSDESLPPDEAPLPPSDGVVDGSLYLVGDGDPALGSRSFAKRHNLPVTPLKVLAADVRRAGIRRVKGKLRVDAGIFDRKRGTGRNTGLIGRAHDQ